MSPQNKIEQLYATKCYLDAYSEHTDLRMEQDPHEAVGGMWEELGKLQFDFLVSRGLRPHHSLLDIGCGSLRGGRHFIGYLDAGKYSGIDISPKAIECGRQLTEKEGLSEKRPRLLVTSNKDLRFTEFNGETFHYLLAQSVFTHLQPEHIEECFRHIGHVMRQDAVLYFTFNEAPEFRQSGLKDFQHSRTFFQSLANEHAFDLDDCSQSYAHPRGQRMAALTKKISL